MEKEKIKEKLLSLFKEEQWGRIEAKDIGISKFKILDDLFNKFVSGGWVEEASAMCKGHLAENPDSIIGSYLLGCLGYHSGQIEDTVYLRKLIDLYVGNHKWAVVEKISEKILEYGENRIALKSLATSLERLGRNREATPVWESLLKLDRFDTSVAKKLAFAILEEDPDKSVQYMKLSIEGFLKNGEYDEIPELWNKLISVSWEDIQFFERIERMLVEAKQQELAASLLKSLLNKYRDEENPDQSIEIIKNILEYTPFDNSARRELVKLYEKKYANHSQFQQFLKLSRLNNFKYPVKHAIQDFEKNIVFDKGNFVFHRSWGVGKITGLDSEGIIIDFKGKENHKMSIQMALQSLAPINGDHIYAIEYEDPATLKTLFTEDFNQYFELLIKSYNGNITLADIKKELIPKFVEEKNWSKWWSKARTVIKKNPNFGISESKKNEIFLRDKPITFAEELLNKFISSDSFSDRLDIAIEFTNNIEPEEGASVIQYLIDYFNSQMKGESHTKQILSYFIIGGFSRFIDAKKLKVGMARDKIIEFIRDSADLPLISMKIDSYDYKKDFVKLIEETRQDWPHVVAEFLMETPVRIHKYIINNLIQANAYNIINKFIDRSITGAKENPEIFLWVSRNLLTETWDYDWLDYSRETLVLTLFRLLNELKKIETKGNRLKNMAVEILFSNEDKILKDIIERSKESFLSKIYDLFKNVSYIEESNVNKFHSLIKKKFPEFTTTAGTAGEESWEREVEKLIVSRAGFDKMNAELNRMVSVEMVNLSKELSKVADVSGDVRENVDYNALMEKQTILKMSISKLQDELKKASILDLNSVSTDSVNIGVNVRFENLDTGENGNYVILGPWDADYERRILSYRSPMAMALLGKKAGDEVVMKVGEESKKLKISSIEKYIG